MNKFNNQNQNNQSGFEKEAVWKSRELELWMDNTEELYRIKQAWANLYIKKIKKGKFNLDLAVKGMDNLRKQVQGHYNKQNPESKITVSKDELKIVLVTLLVLVLYEMVELDGSVRSECISFLEELKHY